MRRLLGALLLLAVFGCQRAQYQNGCCTERERMAGLVARTVKIEVECPEGKTWGSGVLLGPYAGSAVIATADHVVEKPPGCTFKVRDVPAQVLARDTKSDVALMQAALPTVPLLEKSRPYLGQSIAVVGYPLQFFTEKPGLQVSRGNLMADFGTVYRMSAPTFMGNSGGPVFDEDGRLVGLFISLTTLQPLGVGPIYPVDGAYYVAPASKVFELYARLPRQAGQ